MVHPGCSHPAVIINERCCDAEFAFRSNPVSLSTPPVLLPVVAAVSSPLSKKSLACRVVHIKPPYSSKVLHDGFARVLHGLELYAHRDGFLCFARLATLTHGMGTTAKHAASLQPKRLSQPRSRVPRGEVGQNRERWRWWHLCPRHILAVRVA